MPSYQVTVEKYNGEYFSDTVPSVKSEVDRLAKLHSLGEKITIKRVQFEGMSPQTYHFYENGRIRVRRDLSQPRLRLVRSSV